MKVVLIDTDEFNLNLTKGKTYSIIRLIPEGNLHYDIYEVLDDNNEICYPIKHRFISLKKYRKQKLNRIDKIYGKE